MIGTIVAGSTFKGVVAGLIVGLVARKTQSTAMLVGVGLAVGSAVRLPRDDRHAVFLGDRPAWIDRRPDRWVRDREISRRRQKLHGMKPIMPHDDRYPRSPARRSTRRARRRAATAGAVAPRVDREQQRQDRGRGHQHGAREHRRCPRVPRAERQVADVHHADHRQHECDGAQQQKQLQPPESAPASARRRVQRSTAISISSGVTTSAAEISTGQRTLSICHRGRRSA